MSARGYSANMGWLEKVRGFFGRSDERAAPVATSLKASNFEGGLLAPGSGRGPPARGTRELIQAYRTQPWLRAVTSRIARGVASVRWGVYVRSETPAPSKGGRMAPVWKWGVDRAVRDYALTSPNRAARAERMRSLQRDGLLREVVDHPLLKLLQCPNEMMSGLTALKVTQVWLDIKGEAFWLLSFGADGLPNSAWPIPPHWVTQVPTTGAPYFTVQTGAISMRVEPKAVIWLRDVDPENPYGRGTGIAESLGDELETDEFASKYVKAWFFNNATPSLIVSFEEARGQQLEEARDRWERNHRGLHNAHRTHFASGKMNAVKLDTAFRDQQLVELRKAMRDTVIQVFGVPPEAIGVIENSNRATIDAASYMYAIGVEHPRCEFLRVELSAQLLTRYPGGDAALLECELSAPADLGRRLEVMKAQQGAFTLNEWREEAGYEEMHELVGRFPAALPGQDPATTGADGEPPEAEDDGEDEGETELPEMEAERMDPPWVKNLKG